MPSKDARSVKQSPCQSARSTGRGTDGKASDEMGKELVEPKDIKAHLLETLYQNLLSTADRATAVQSNVAQNSANWRNFASQV
jgi:hypothetical protein